MAALPTTGISTTLVRQTIGAGTNDVAALCTHKNINKWSRYKPSYKEYGNSSFALSGTRYDYRLPAGGAAEPFRLGDFRGYDHTFREVALDYTAEYTSYSDSTIIDVYYNCPVYVLDNFVYTNKLYMALARAVKTNSGYGTMSLAYQLLEMIPGRNDYHFTVKVGDLGVDMFTDTDVELYIGVFQKITDANGVERTILYCTIGNINEDHDLIGISLKFSAHVSRVIVLLTQVAGTTPVCRKGAVYYTPKKYVEGDKSKIIADLTITNFTSTQLRNWVITRDIGDGKSISVCPIYSSDYSTTKVTTIVKEVTLPVDCSNRWNIFPS